MTVAGARGGGGVGVVPAARAQGGDGEEGWRRPPDLVVEARRPPELEVEAGGMGYLRFHRSLGHARARRDGRDDAGLVSFANRYARYPNT